MSQTTQTQPGDLLAPLLALVAEWRDQGETFGPSVGHLARKACADQLQAAIESIAAHRGEADKLAVARVQRGPAPHDPLYAMLLPGVDESRVPPGTPLYAHPPQAQAGAGDAITDERVDRALLAFHGEGGNFHHIQWTADQRRSMRAALEAKP